MMTVRRRLLILGNHLAALPDLVKRLGLNLSPGGQLSNDDYDKLEQEVMGKRSGREM